VGGIGNNTVMPPTVEAEIMKQGGWTLPKEYPTTYMKKIGNDVACASLNNKDCLWRKKGKLTYGQLKTLATQGDQKALVCGPMHTKHWKGPGYGNPKHWCERLRPVLGARPEVMTQLTPPHIGKDEVAPTVLQAYAYLHCGPKQYFKNYPGQVFPLKEGTHQAPKGISSAWLPAKYTLTLTKTSPKKEQKVYGPFAKPTMVTCFVDSGFNDVVSTYTLQPPVTQPPETTKPDTTPPPAQMGPYVMKTLRIQHAGTINLPEIEVYDMDNQNVAPKATMAMSSIYQNRKPDDPMFGLQVGTDGWFVANKDGKHHMLHSGGGSVKSLTMTWPEDIKVRRIVIYNRDRGCGAKDLECAKRLIGATVVGTDAQGKNTMSYTIPDVRSVYVLGDACNSYDWPPAEKGAYEQAFRAKISACFGQGGCLNAESGACLNTTPPPKPTTPAPSTAPQTSTPAPQYPYAGRALVEVVQELQRKFPNKPVMTIEERRLETVKLDLRSTIVVVWRRAGDQKAVRQVLGIPGEGGAAPPGPEQTTPQQQCPQIEEGTTVLDGSDGSLYKFENNSLRPYMTQEIYKSHGSPQYTVFTKDQLKGCFRGPAMSLKETTPAPQDTTAAPTPTEPQWDKTVYLLVHGPTYDRDGTLRVLTVKFGTLGLQAYNQRDPAQGFVMNAMSNMIRNVGGQGEYLASNEGCLAPMTTTQVPQDDDTSVRWKLQPTGSHQYSYVIRAECGRSLFAGEDDARVVTLESGGSPFYVVPVGSLA
jgi:hypothetical protein